MKEKNKKIGKFTIIMDQSLGKGSFGSTYKAYAGKDYDHPFACKIIDKNEIKSMGFNSQYFIQRVRQEFKALQSLKHENIVKFEDFQETKNNLYMFFQYCEGDLERYITSHCFQKQNQKEIYKFAKQIIAGCTYFTQLGFVHRDIKPANILIKGNSIKIADFGLAKLIQSNNELNTVTYAGTPHYMAPQIMKQSSKLKQIRKCDVWSVGVTVYELATSHLPFGIEKKQLSEKKVMDRIQSKPKGSRILIEGNPLLEKLINLMLVEEPEKRISFEQADEIIKDFQLNQGV